MPVGASVRCVPLQLKHHCSHWKCRGALLDSTRLRACGRCSAQSARHQSDGTAGVSAGSRNGNRTGCIMSAKVVRSLVKIERQKNYPGTSGAVEMRRPDCSYEQQCPTSPLMYPTRDDEHLSQVNDGAGYGGPLNPVWPVSRQHLSPVIDAGRSGNAFSGKASIARATRIRDGVLSAPLKLPPNRRGEAARRKF